MIRCSVALTMAWLLAGCAAPVPRVVLTSESPRGFAVLGLASEELTKLRGASLSDDAWRRAFRVSVASDGLEDVPPVAGTWSVTDDAVVFRPLFDPAPGTSYHVVFAAAGLSLSERVSVPAMEITPKTELVRIDPTCDVLPENQLKIYLHFSRPMRRFGSYEHIELVDLGEIAGDGGTPVKAPFLELGEELWNGPGTRLTVFFDPGRVKRFLQPHDELGPPLRAGQAYEIRVDPKWPDATGAPLLRGFSKRFRVGPPDYESPDIDSWRLSSPRTGSRDALRVEFPESLDRALVERLIWVERQGAEVAGEVGISDCERDWSFVPDRPWASGDHELVVQTVLEDLAGNSIASPFEVELFQRTKPRVEDRAVRRAIPLK